MLPPDPGPILSEPRTHSTISRTASSVPSKTASTDPSLRFVTHPATLCSRAACWQLSRKKTPCTLPETTTRFLITSGFLPDLPAAHTVQPRACGQPLWEPEGAHGGRSAIAAVAGG
jgi:hypothetical protein